VIEVRDTGPGIAAGRLDYLFDRFTRLSDAGAEPYGGAGLGLAISKAIVEGLGGKISVKTRLGQGSSFSFWVPACPAEAADDEESSPRLRILVAHTDAEIGRLVATALAPLKVEVSTASDCEASAKLAARGGVDVILADLDLARAGGAGWRKLRNGRGRHARIPVVAVSSLASDALYAEVLEDGFQGMLTTPFTPSDLTSAIAHAFAMDARPA
jgi:CheY-like chemotaxis protein